MKERQMLFNAPMVRAILEGRKTQTRRVLKPQPVQFVDSIYRPFPGEPNNWQGYGDGGNGNDGQIYWYGRCPYGQPGDRLWVRETWAEVGTCDPGLIVYRADYPDCVPRQYENIPPAKEIRWRPSIHQRREHSRITLRITAVRVERLNDISKDDAIAEGLYQDQAGRWTTWSATEKHREHLNPVEAYRELWESINGPGSWEANPWVWVVEFRKID